MSPAWYRVLRAAPTWTPAARREHKEPGRSTHSECQRLCERRRWRRLFRPASVRLPLPPHKRGHTEPQAGDAHLMLLFTQRHQLWIKGEFLHTNQSPGELVCCRAAAYESPHTDLFCLLTLCGARRSPLIPGTTFLVLQAETLSQIALPGSAYSRRALFYPTQKHTQVSGSFSADGWNTRRVSNTHWMVSD